MASELNFAAMVGKLEVSKQHELHSGSLLTKQSVNHQIQLSVLLHTGGKDIRVAMEQNLGHHQLEFKCLVGLL